MKLLSFTTAMLLAWVPSMADDGEMFSKNVSKTPEYVTEYAALKMLPVYVPTQSSDGTMLDYVEIDINDVEADGSSTDVELLQLSYVRPLVSYYTDGPVEYIDDPLYGGFPGHGERDAFAAVSLDDGATWQRTNLSNSADLSSFSIKRGGGQNVPYPGDVGRSFLAADGNQVLAVWVSRFAGGGNPNYAMTDDERLAVAEYMGLDVTACIDGDLIETPCLYLEDHFGVAGSQGSSDLADEGLPLVGELPYAALWAARGVILPPAATGLETNTVVWFKAERLSSAVRDANRPEAVCAKGAGCVVTWQEDPGGIRPGEGEGPGEGWSGAIAHHQTDTWYSYISWKNLPLVSEDGTYGNLYDETGDLATWVVNNATGRPQAAIPMSIPVRLTDNAMCTDTSTYPYCHMDFDGNGITDFCASTVAVTIETPEGPTSDVNMCVTEDGRLMRGNTASTRARVGLHEYSTTVRYVFGGVDNSDFFESIDSAWFSMSYEENKGLGECEDDENAANPDICATADIVDKIDMGKNVWYHTFDMFNPELVSQGLMLNQPAVYPEEWDDASGILLQDTSLGYNFYQIKVDPIYELTAGLESTLYQTEISRRPSPITQDWYLVGETGTVGFQLWKQGIIRRGGPADIMGRSFVIDFSTFVSTTDNPYDYTNMACDTWAFDDGSNPRYVKGFCADPAVNISANTIISGEGETCTDATTCLEAFPFNEYYDDLAGGTAIPKIYEWQWFGPGYGETTTDTALTNFDDPSWENPYDVAKGHRGFLNGDMLMVMYAWSPNWMANTVGHDNYNLYNRRSFDGGLTWSTTPTEYGGDGTTTCEWMGPAGSDTEYPVCTTYAAGEFEQARNVSQLAGTRETVLDPRFTPTPPAITEASLTTLLPEGFSTEGITLDDTRNPSIFFMVYETGDNTTVALGEADPLDLYYSRAINWGDDYQVWADEGELDAECLPGADDDDLLDGFCNEFEPLEGSQFSESGEASVITNPSGRFFYAVWNQVDFGVDGLSEDSDMWYRRVLYWYSPEYTIPTFNFGPTRHDFTQDNLADILWWNPIDQRTFLWVSQTDAKPVKRWVGYTPEGYTVAGTGDFDADGDADILLRDPSDGRTGIWIMEAGSVAGWKWLGYFDISYVVGAIGDADADGDDDIVWFNPTAGYTTLWSIGPGYTKSGMYLGRLTGYQIKGAGDFDRDGDADLLLHDPADGRTAIWLMKAGSKPTFKWLGYNNIAFHVAGIGDLDGDGDDDIMWNNPSTTPMQNRWWKMESATKVSNLWLGYFETGFIVGPILDLDGDGDDDIVWRNPTDARNFQWVMEGGVRTSTKWLGYFDAAFEIH